MTILKVNGVMQAMRIHLVTTPACKQRRHASTHRIFGQFWESGADGGFALVSARCRTSIIL